MTGGVTYALPAVLDSAAAAELKDQLLAHRLRDLTVSGEAVERAGALPLQVLAAAANLWAADERDFTITAPSAALREAARLTGLAATLNIGLAAS